MIAEVAIVVRTNEVEIVAMTAVMTPEMMTVGTSLARTETLVNAPANEAMAVIGKRLADVMTGVAKAEEEGITPQYPN